MTFVSFDVFETHCCLFFCLLFNTPFLYYYISGYFPENYNLFIIALKAHLELSIKVK